MIYPPTSRQMEVWRLIAEGRSSPQIAAILGCSLKTVGNHRLHLNRRLGLHNVADVTRAAVAYGLIQVPVLPLEARSRFRPANAVSVYQVPEDANPLPPSRPSPAPSLSARSVLKLGQRVQLTDAGYRAGQTFPHWKGPRQPTGIVKGFCFGARERSFWVQRDGHKSRRLASLEHWEPIPLDTTPAPSTVIP